ncbi:putative DNA double-strand break repair Rad50 ATPase [Ixodes scapularis]
MAKKPKDVGSALCVNRPQDPAYGTDVEQDYVAPKDVQLSGHTWDEEDHEEYIIDTLKDISKTLREKFLLLAEKIKEKINELRQAAGGRASLLKEQLSDLKHQLEESTSILKRKVQDLFDKGQYATMGDNALETFAKFYELRGRLNKFVHGMKDMTGEKLEKLAELVRELRHKIEKKVQELMYGSSGTDVALYHGSDEIDDEAYVIQTLREISRTLKEKFLLLESDHVEDDEAYIIDTLKGISVALKERFATLVEKIRQKLLELKGAAGEQTKAIKDQLENFKNQLRESRQALQQEANVDDDQNDKRAYVINTLKDIAKSLKEKFLNIGEKIRQKLAELKTAAGAQVVRIKEQLKELAKQMFKAREELREKLKELARPKQTQYAYFNDQGFDIFSKITHIKEKLASFLKRMKDLTGETLAKLRTEVGELREAIKQQISQLLQGSDNTPALYLAIEDIEDNEAYIIDTLKDISKTLKEKFMVSVRKLD